MRKLCTMLQSSQHPIVILIDHSATKGIVEQMSLNTTSTDQLNCRLQVASIYLSQYNLRIHYIAGRLNFISNTLLQLATVFSTSKMPDNKLPALNNIWLASEAIITDKTREVFTTVYTIDCKFKAVINHIRQDKGTLNAFKEGVPFKLINRLLYHIGPRPDFIRHLCILYVKVKKILEIAYN